jgi:tRNA A37 threonylcarbamoyladenosine biosynthesis protein TsaE
MHDFANNSEAIKENAIGFVEWVAKFGSIYNNPTKPKVTIMFDADETNKVCSVQDAYNIYLTNKEK